MSSGDGTSLRSAPRVTFGVVLFIAWGLETVLWVASTIDLAADGEITPVITALVALSLMTLLAGMEGLEVAVIDRWRINFPDRTTNELAGWLAARQLFVALIVTSATLLANRSTIIVPGTGASIDHGILLGLFDLTWTGFTAWRVGRCGGRAPSQLADDARGGDAGGGHPARGVAGRHLA
jgi:hypothetical protein